MLMVHLVLMRQATATTAVCAMHWILSCTVAIVNDSLSRSERRMIL